VRGRGSRIIQPMKPPIAPKRRKKKVFFITQI
jgi:hypothetical protein